MFQILILAIRSLVANPPQLQFLNTTYILKTYPNGFNLIKKPTCARRLLDPWTNIVIFIRSVTDKPALSRPSQLKHHCTQIPI